MTEQTAVATSTLPVVKAKKASAPKAKTAAKKANGKAKAPAKVRDPNAVSKSVIPLDVAKTYQRTKNKDGKLRVDNGDDTAVKLRNMTLDQVYTYGAKVTGVAEKDLRAKYGHLNFGMQRMNVGNKIRAVLNAKDE